MITACTRRCLLSSSSQLLPAPRLPRRCASTKGAGRTPRTKTYSLVSAATSPVATSSLTSDGHSIATDLPHIIGGDDTAAQPVYLLLASLVGCEHATAAFVARQMKPRVNLRGVHFDISAERDERGAIALPLTTPAEELPHSRLQRIAGTATVDCDATQEQVDELSRLVKLRCPVANMVSLSGCELDIKWQKGGLPVDGAPS